MEYDLRRASERAQNPKPLDSHAAKGKSFPLSALVRMLITVSVRRAVCALLPSSSNKHPTGGGAVKGGQGHHMGGYEPSLCRR